MKDAVAIVLAAGTGDRLRSEIPKAFVPLGARTLLAHAVMSALSSPRVVRVVVAAPAGWEDLARTILEPLGSHGVVTGGDTRRASVRAALAAVPASAETVLCHDAARPFATAVLFDAVLAALDGWDGVVPVVPIADTVKRVRGETVEGSEPRGTLALAQTPQAFRAMALRDAHARAEEAGAEMTDDAAALELAGYRVRAIPGEDGNFKITTSEDLVRAEAAWSELARG
ncbi:MAG: 2-C-methyl-D-erythritol 4-phosphate cytidylyltransferase [Actinomycetota bacterium]